MSYALQRALDTRGQEFPLIGLLHDVSIGDIPTALKIRLCINLADLDWVEQVKAGVSGTPPGQTIEPKAQYVAKIHENYLRRQGQVAIEIRPRFAQLTSWRIGFPSNGPQPIRWGAGPANGGGISGTKSDALEGECHDIGGGPMKFVGASNVLTASISAYAVFDPELPDRCFFGVAKEACGTEVEWNIINLSTLCREQG